MKLQHQFFEDTVKKYPNYIAVDDHGKKITYKNLNIYANRIANLLSVNGCKNNDRVCVLTKKNINLYASILGILKAGSCWVPLSSSFPGQRLNLLIKELEPKFIIIENDYFDLIKSLINKKITKILIIDSKKKQKKLFFTNNDLNKFEGKLISRKIYSEDLAYIIFTSGSTGKPKGVMVTHGNTSHFLKNSSIYFKPNRKSRFAHIAEIVFDPSIFDLFVCWKNAGTVVPFNRNEYKIDNIKFFKNNKNINVCFFLPSFFKSLDDRNQLNSKYLSNLKHIGLTGEMVPPDLIKSFYKKIKGIKIYNAYGTTEAAIISHWYKIPKQKEYPKGIAVGKELPNVKTLLLDNNKECETNKSGLAFFLSPQVSIGYWNNSFMTNLYFVKNPINKKFNQIIYKAGDVLKRENSGLFYYVGRQDNQIKLRGHRVEMDEIENFVKDDMNVDDCVAIPYSRTNNKLFTDVFLFIKLVKEKNKKYFDEIISKKLPKYMQPTNIFLQMKDYPRNLNGKIDKKRLLKIILKHLA